MTAVNASAGEQTMLANKAKIAIDERPMSTSNL
jgi:hypothetical protein